MKEHPEPTIARAYTELRDPDKPIVLQQSLERRRHASMLEMRAVEGMKAGVSMTAVYRGLFPTPKTP